MTTNDLVETYITHLGLRRIKGSGADPILPFFMLDVMNTIFREDILPLSKRFEAKKVAKDWARNYHEFNSDFFSAFNEEQQDRVIDIMDRFEAYIGNDVMVTKVAVMNHLSRYGVELEDQRVIASCMVCNILAQSAQILWEAVYNHRENPFIRAIMWHSHKWMNIYIKTRSDAHINPNNSKELVTAVDILCKKMVRFLDSIEKA